MANTYSFAKSCRIFFYPYISYSFIFNVYFLNWIMREEFKQISTSNGFMKHNGGILFRTISENEYEFKTKINENHLNAAKITHGGFIAALTDAGVGTAAHRTTGANICVTISLELKFISQVKLGQELIGLVKVQKKTKSLVFLTCELRADDKIAATASGVWKIIKK